MATGLGLTVGSMHAVAVTNPTDTAAHPDGTAVVYPTALVLTGDGATLLPASGRPDGAVVTGYANRVGDPVALISDDGTAHTGEDLVATTMRGLTDALPPADAVVAAHPAVWSGYQADVLVAALERAGLPDATLVTEPLAATAWLHRTRPGSADAPVVVYDLGAGSLDVTVVGPGEQPEILGTPLRSEDYSGAEFDHATMRYVLDGMAGGTEGMDPFDAGTVAALTELRARCRAAKEALSSDTATVIAVDLPGVHSDVRLVREELEDLIREPLADSVNLVHEAVRGAGLELSDIGLVLLVGGSTAIPLVTELLSAALRLPVVADADPVSTSAAGAAMLASARAAAAPSDSGTAAFAAGGTAAFAAVGTADDAAGDTAAFAVLGATLGDRASAPAAPMSAPVTVTASRRTGGLSTPKKAALVSAAAAALLALTAGGVSLGTGALSPTAGSQPTHGITAPSTATGTGAPESVPGSTAPGATASATAADPAGTVAGGSTAAPGTAQAVTVAGTPGAAAPAAASAPASAPSPAASPAPAATAPASQDAATAPAAPQAPATGNGAGEVATGVGQGIGEAATGVGQGVGGVVGGVGQGVGGVVSGVGGVVGGVGNAVGGVVGGLLGN